MKAAIELCKQKGLDPKYKDIFAEVFRDMGTMLEVMGKLDQELSKAPPEGGDACKGRDGAL